jgi:cell wall assembly regulator SMI1
LSYPCGEVKSDDGGREVEGTMGERTTWRPFLEQWSTEWVAGHDPDKDAPLAQEVVRDAWLGFAPASEVEVAAAEARLGRRLPPSLREFLLVTNGWRDAGNFIYRLAGAAELEWLRDTDDRTWIEVWEDLAEDESKRTRTVRRRSAFRRRRSSRAACACPLRVTRRSCCSTPTTWT